MVDDDWAPADEVRVLIKLINQVEGQGNQLEELRAYAERAAANANKSEARSDRQDLAAARLRLNNKELTRRLDRLEAVVNQLLTGRWHLEPSDKPSTQKAAAMLASVCDGAVFNEEYDPV